MKYPLVCILVLSFFIACNAQSNQLSLKDAINTALSNNLEIKIANQQRVVAKNKLEQTLRAWWPQIELTGGSYFQKTEPNSNSKSPDNIPSYIPATYQDLYKALLLPSDSQRYITTFALGLKQLLIDNGVAKFQIQTALLKKELADLDLAIAQQAITIQVTNTYYKLQQEFIAIQKEKVIVQQRQNIVELKDQELAIRTITEDNLVESKLNLQVAETQLAERQNSYTDLLESLQNLLGTKINITANLEQKLLSSDNLYNFDLRNISVSENLEMKRAKLLFKIKKLEVIQVESEIKPVVQLSGQYAFDHSQESFAKAFRDFNTSWQAGIEMSWPIFKGGSTGFAIEALQAELAKEQLSLARLLYQLELDLRKTKRGYETAKKQLTDASTKLELAKTQYATAQKQIQQRLISDTELSLKRDAVTLAEHTCRQVGLELRLNIPKLEELSGRIINETL